ncbi:hypothetical protein LA080_008968 [Diaporthe eres]|nr:hypothetical protein LA080_008968 [Diaporthe eres]
MSDIKTPDNKKAANKSRFTNPSPADKSPSPLASSTVSLYDLASRFIFLTKPQLLLRLHFTLHKTNH